MENRRVEDAEPPQDFFDAVYEEDDNQKCLEDWEDEDQDPLELLEPEVVLEDGDPSLLSSPIAPSYEPVTSPTRRSRSRSPLRRVPNALNDIATGPYEVQEGELNTPVAHSMFDVPNEVDVSDGTQVMYGRNDDGDERIEVRVRGRQRGRSGIRGRGQGHTRRGRGERRRGVGERTPQWRVGDPLQIIWTDDGDVPAELQQMVMNVARRREAMDARIARERKAREGNVLENDKVFYDADDRDDDLLAGDDRHFKWSPDMENFLKDEMPFSPERTGSVEEFSTAYDAFRSYWDDPILATIAEQTNLYAAKITASAFQQSWISTNSHEVLCLFAFWMMLGIIRMPTIKSCFSEESLLKVDIFKKIFTKARYEHLVRALHFVEADPGMKSVASTSISGPEVADRTHCLTHVFDQLNAKFQANYILSKDIRIDETLTSASMEGWLNIKQNISTKAKFGIKTYELCEVATGYLWSFVVQTDLLSDTFMLKGTTVVRRLMTPLLNKGYRLFMDDWYNSPLLARWLKFNGTDCVGTLHPTQSDVPPIINLAELKQGQLLARHSGDVCVAAWQDKTKIVTISTCHGAETGLSRVLSRPSSRLPFKPQVVLDYNRCMGGVNLKGEMLEPYLLERKRCKKWYMKLFKRLLNCSILNARVLLASSTQTDQNHLVFVLSLVDSILNNHLHLCPNNRTKTNRINVDPIRITTNTHWPVHIPQSNADAARNRQSRQKCFICSKQGRKFQKTPYMCELCKVPLCIVNCFKSYHTAPNMM